MFIWWKTWNNIPFFWYEYLIIAVPFVENTILSALNCLCTFVKNQLIKCMWIYFWTLHSVPLIHVSILKAVVYFETFLFSRQVAECHSISLPLFPYSSTGQLSLILSSSDIYPKHIYNGSKISLYLLPVLFSSFHFYLIYAYLGSGVQMWWKDLEYCILLRTNQ